ncbi:Trk system potassium transporter TrkA [Candidatus Uabimicrobium amorphum]|uniref:Trk system potassium uptake protein TrkA n=1 Tax=Uabimicrobium amorphum TaxID=2596890 RepID=A0A5S9INL5_UABAM|nr:Trk system potassium transporter TrkA [Candidatus Uabimicrobium amorphum]BBM84641.1 Trk system potassium transport protein TrkA [Candidatus Uabimicrobium amorphum]
MNIIILGAGSVGLHLATELSCLGNNVTIVDTNKDKLAHIQEVCDVQSVQGNAADLSVLVKAGLQDCQLLLATTNNDEANMLSCLLAKNVGVATTIARLRQDFYFRGHKTLYRNKMGIDLIVCPEILAALDVIGYTKELKSSVVETLADGNIEVKTIRVSRNFKYKNYILNEIPFPENTLVSGVVRDDKLTIPRGNYKIQEDDILYIIGKTEVVEHMGGVFDPKKEGWFFSQHKTAFVLGGGHIGFLVAKLLSMHEIEVKLIEEDPEKCKQVAAALPDITVFNEDGTNDKFLHEEGIENADYFISACKEVETSLVASLLAKDMGVKEVISVIDNDRYNRVLQRLGINNIVNPRNKTSQCILEFIGNGNVLTHTLGRFEDAHLIEMYTTENFPLKGKTLQEINLPENTLVCIIQRGEEVFVPKGSDHIQVGDMVVIFTIGEHIDAIQKLFGR